MRLGITLEDEKGLDGNVSQHFGQCSYFLIVDIEKDKVITTKVVANTTQHGGGGCVAVDALLKHDVSHVISGGMGMGAQQKFAQAGTQVSGFSGTVKDAIDCFLKNSLDSLGACREHGECH